MNWLFFACLFIASAIFMSWSFTLGLLLGGAISSLNFHFLKRDIKTFLLPGNQDSQIKIIAFSYLRLTLTAAALYYIISLELTDIFGLVAGLCLIVVGLFLGIMWEYRRHFFPSKGGPPRRDTLDKGDDLQ